MIGKRKILVHSDVLPERMQFYRILKICESLFTGALTGTDKLWVNLNY